MRFLISSLFILLFFNAKAQNARYNSLLIPAELKVNSNAVVRNSENIIEILAHDKITIKKKRVVTVLNKYGDRYIRAYEFYDKMSSIKAMEAFIYDSSGNLIKKIKKKDFTDTSAVSDFSIYEDDRVKYLDYNPLKYPYTVVYTSEVTLNTTAFFPSWRPISGYYESIERSEYKIINTANVDLKTKKENFEGFNIEEKRKNHFVARNIEGIKYEAFAPSLTSFVPNYKVAMKKFSMSGVEGENNNWNEFGKWMYDKLISDTVEIPEATIREVKTLTNGIENDLEKAKIVYEYMQNKTRYISVQIGIGGWKPMMASDVDKLGYADCKGLSNYTKSLLEAVGVNSYYTLVYGDNEIRNIDKDFSSNQGNHAILCIPQDNENVFLECTSQTNPFGFIAGFTDDRDVLLVKPNGGEIVHTTVYDENDSKKITKANVELDNLGTVTAEVNIKSTGLKYNSRERIVKKSQRDQQLYYKNYWDYLNNLNIESIHLNNNKDDVVLTENLKINALSYASKSGSRLLIQPNLFNRISKIPTRYDERSLKFSIERSFSDIDEFIINYPEDLSVEAISKPINIETSFGIYICSIEKLEDNKLKYSRKYILKKGTYNKEIYQEYRAFMKKVVKSDKSKIVFNKIHN